MAPRHLLLPPPSTQAADVQHALYAFSASRPTRRSINTHIVVVGASECGLSVVESLLFSQSLSFTAITLLAPGGLLSEGLYSRTVLARLVGFNASSDPPAHKHAMLYVNIVCNYISCSVQDSVLSLC